MAKRWPVVHPECGGIAFYALKDWRNGDRMDAEDAIMPDGSHPVPESLMYCGTCGRVASPRTLVFGEPEEIDA